MNSLIWIHEEFLSKTYLKNLESTKDYKAFFVWDQDYLKEMNYSFKRLVFIYETLCEMNIDIYHGKTAEVIFRLAAENNCYEIHFAKTLNPLLQEITDKLASKFTVKYIKKDDFVELDSDFKSERFFKFWHKIKKQAFLENGKI